MHSEFHVDCVKRNTKNASDQMTDTFAGANLRATRIYTCGIAVIRYENERNVPIAVDPSSSTKSRFFDEGFIVSDTQYMKM